MIYQKIKFNNGLRLILVPQPKNVAATVLTLVEAGSKYETKDINGISHFLEHMCFKGTLKRPHAIDISGELDGLGAEYNAFTSHEWTGYFAKVRAGEIYEAIDLISDLYLNPVFTPVEIEKEKGVVIEEINMYEDMPPRRVQELFMSLLYGDQPAGWDIAGRKEVIRKITRDDLVKYRKNHYVAKATVIVIAGAFDVKKVKESVRDNFSTIVSDRKAGKNKTIERQNRPKTFLKFKESDQTHLILGCRAFDVFDKRRFAIEVLSDILGGGMSSRLFQKVREELGAAYYIKSSADLLSDHGYLAVAAGVDHKKTEAVIEAILEEMDRLSKDKVRPDELERAKNHLSGRLLLGLETSDSLALYYGSQEILKTPIYTPRELLRKVEAVTSGEILSLAKHIFKDNKLNLAAIGPYKNDSRFQKILKF
jgi:predicted Zn-dependent peptidase